NYLNNILAKIEAIDAGVLEAIMLNREGEVSECTGDNLIVVKDGAVSTPPTGSGILHGITRTVKTGTVQITDHITGRGRHTPQPQPESHTDPGTQGMVDAEEKVAERKSTACQPLELIPQRDPKGRDQPARIPAVAIGQQPDQILLYGGPVLKASRGDQVSDQGQSWGIVGGNARCVTHADSLPAQRNAGSSPIECRRIPNWPAWYASCCPKPTSTSRMGRS
ncbi:MAG: aminotransferase class IV, partial [Candidatus Cloacimonetes bacterium]|nr:aminotransferase class IV [Candidatus Cloacimonadota bacterium]